MRKIKFEYAGIRHENEFVFLTSKHRKITKTIFHRNRYHSEIRIPAEFLKEHFKFNRFTGAYETDLKMGDIERFLKVYDMDKKEYISQKLYNDYHNNFTFQSGIK